MATWGSRIRAAREELGLTQAELGKQVGAHAQTVLRWEVGVAEPRKSIRPRIAEVLGHTQAFRDPHAGIVDRATAAFKSVMDASLADAQTPPHREPDPGILELLADPARCAALRLTEQEVEFLRQGAALGGGYVLRTADDAAEFILFLRRYKAI